MLDEIDIDPSLLKPWEGSWFSAYEDPLIAKRPAHLDTHVPPLSELVRIEMEFDKNSGCPLPVSYMGIEKNYPANYLPPTWMADKEACFAYHLDIGQRKYDQAQLKIGAFTDICTDFTYPVSSRDGLSIECTNVEKSFIERTKLRGNTVPPGTKGMALLNPSEGTISRLAAAGIYSWPIFITDTLGSYTSKQYKLAIVERCESVNYAGEVQKIPWEELDKSYCYYCSFTVDKARRHRLPFYLGFEINPYVYASKGFSFMSVNRFDTGSRLGNKGYWLGYPRQDYIYVASYPPDDCCDDRVPPDVLARYLRPSVHYSESEMNGLHNYCATFELANIPAYLGYEEGVSSNLDVRYLHAKGRPVEEHEELVIDGRKMGLVRFSKIGDTYLDLQVAGNYYHRRAVLSQSGRPVFQWSNTPTEWCYNPGCNNLIWHGEIFRFDMLTYSTRKVVNDRLPMEYIGKPLKSLRLWEPSCGYNNFVTILIDQDDITQDVYMGGVVLSGRPCYNDRYEITVLEKPDAHYNPTRRTYVRCKKGPWKSINTAYSFFAPGSYPLRFDLVDVMRSEEHFVRSSWMNVCGTLSYAGSTTVDLDPDPMVIPEHDFLSYLTVELRDELADLLSLPVDKGKSLFWLGLSRILEVPCGNEAEFVHRLMTETGAHLPWDALTIAAWRLGIKGYDGSTLPHNLDWRPRDISTGLEL